MTRKDQILGTVEDLVADLLFYDRKEDEDLPRGAIEEAIAAREVSQAEIVQQFTVSLAEGLA
jgi:hypothetical protein